MFERGNFVDAARVPVAVEGRRQPNANERLVFDDADKFAGKTKDVRVVMSTAELGGDFVATKRRANAANFVRRDAHADAGAANENPFVRFAGRDRFGDRRRDVRIVERFDGAFSLKIRLANLDAPGRRSLERINRDFLVRLGALALVERVGKRRADDQMRADEPFAVSPSFFAQVGVMFAK